jgi:1-acyl-sn-glycerol-3-phosphate acyltransferase
MADLFKKWILEPANDFIIALRKTGESLGIQSTIDQTSYMLEEKMFSELFQKAYDFKILGAENIPNDGAAIIAANHQSLIDPIVLGDAICQSNTRQPYQLAKAELMTNPVLNNFARTNHAIFIRRGDSDEQALMKCREILNQGNLLIVFPEGTLGPGNGKFLDFKNGAVRLALACKVPIIPCAIFGSDRIYGRNAKMISTSGKLRVKFGPALPIEKLFKKINKDEDHTNVLRPGITDVDGLDFTRATRRVEREVERLWNDIWGMEQDSKKMKNNSTNDKTETNSSEAK